MPRFLVCDGQSVYRIGLRSLISAEIPRAEVIEASNLPQALAHIRNSTIDLVLVGTGSIKFGRARFLEGSARNLAVYALCRRIHIRHSGRYSRDPGSRISRLYFKTPVRHRDSRRRYGASWLGEFTYRHRSPR